MSYDLYLFAADGDAELDEAWEEWTAAEEADSGRPLTDEERDRNAELAAALAAELGLERYDADDGSIQLVCPEGGPPLDLGLFGTSATAAIPYWEGDEVGEAVRVAFAALRRIKEQTGWRAYDPQLERELDLERDLDDVLAAHAGVTDRVQPVLAADELGTEDPASGRSPRKRWQLWRR